MNMLEKRKAMQEMSAGTYRGNPISKIIDSLGYLGLTDAGRLNLSAFDDAAIKHADIQLKKAKRQPDSQIKFFCYLCVDYSRKNGLTIDRDWESALFKFYGLSTTLSPVKNTETAKTKLSEEIMPSIKTVQAPTPWQPEPREKKHGISELTKLSDSLVAEGFKLVEYLIGGKDAIFNHWVIMSVYWDHGITKQEAVEELKAYEAWCNSRYGKRLFDYFGKHIPFWVTFESN